MSLNTRGQGHSLTLIQVHLDSVFKLLFLKKGMLTEEKFHAMPPWSRGTILVK